MPNLPAHPIRSRAVALPVAAMLMLSACNAPHCATTIVQDVASPDSRRHAVVFEHTCGGRDATVETHASILTTGRHATNTGNVLIVDGPAGRTSARWIDARTVEIHFPTGRNIRYHDNRHDDTDVRFVADSGRPR